MEWSGAARTDQAVYPRATCVERRPPEGKLLPSGWEENIHTSRSTGERRERQMSECDVSASVPELDWHGGGQLRGECVCSHLSHDELLAREAHQRSLSITQTEHTHTHTHAQRRRRRQRDVSQCARERAAHAHGMESDACVLFHSHIEEGVVLLGARSSDRLSKKEWTDKIRCNKERRGRVS